MSSREPRFRPGSARGTGESVETAGSPDPQATRRMKTFRVDGSDRAEDEDPVAVEEPLEIRVVPAGGPRHAVAVTMRTPGEDAELALGFLLTEGVLRSGRDVASVGRCGPARAPQPNVIEVHLAEGVPFDAGRFTRNVYTTSSCGICGRTSLDLVRAAVSQPPRGTTGIPASLLHRLPGLLSEVQPRFRETGGIHAAALFDPEGVVLVAREDVGRHNAVDKVIGHLAAANRLPADDTLLLVSGRASFELVQKALIAGVPALAAVGAPSSLAVDLAREFDMTLVGFLRNGRFNVYAGETRIHA